jgi:hypothetical protein
MPNGFKNIQAGACGSCGNSYGLHSTTCPMKFQCPDLKRKAEIIVCEHDYYKLPGVSMGCVTYKCKFCDATFDKDIT